MRIIAFGGCTAFLQQVGNSGTTDKIRTLLKELRLPTLEERRNVADLVHQKVII
jgi:hypothetical protein